VSCVHESWCRVSGVCCPPARRPPSAERPAKRKENKRTFAKKTSGVYLSPQGQAPLWYFPLSLKKTIHLSTKKKVGSLFCSAGCISLLLVVCA
jgi:hypothetical protein